MAVNPAHEPILAFLYSLNLGPLKIAKVERARLGRSGTSPVL